MAESELLESYKTCKDQKKQIRILADLNCTTVTEIRNYLVSKGCTVPEDGRYAKTKGSNVAESINTSNGTNEAEITVPPTHVPESIRKILNGHRIQLITQIKKLQAEVDDINAFIGEYKKE